MRSFKKFVDGMIEIEVVYAQPRKHWSVRLNLAAETTAAEASELARNSEPMLWIEGFEVAGFAVWGKQVAPTYLLQEGDRLELLRPLALDPMEIRRRKAEEQRS